MQTISTTTHFALLSFLFGALGGLARGAVFSYECNSLPTDGGWTLIGEFCHPEQYLADGWLVQHTQLCDDPPAGQQFDYTRSLAEFDGAQAWFVEWRVFGDGDQSEIPHTSPAVLAAGSFGPVLYHFVIARDRVRLAHDNPGETVYFDIDPAGPHVFRVEQYGTQSFAVFIDGQIVHSGVPGGAFPAFSPAVNIRAKTHAMENWVYWDYIRWGDIPLDASGDFDSNGAIDTFDHFYFSECMDGGSIGEPASPSCAWADFDSNNTVNCADLESFRAAWTGSGDPPAACIAAGVPAASEWGFVMVTLLFLAAGCLIFRYDQRRIHE